MAAQPPKHLTAFCCYAHTDQSLRDQLDEHLSNLKRQYHLNIWFDRQISPGENWEKAIEEKLNSADLILLLISSAFMASNYCYNKEMLHALDRHFKGEAKVIPILLRPVYWQHAPFSVIQMLPKSALPVTCWPNIDEAFYNVTLGIKQVIEESFSLDTIACIICGKNTMKEDNLCISCSSMIN